jgi:Na+/citrate or Na+/malate symporter
MEKVDSFSLFLEQKIAKTFTTFCFGFAFILVLVILVCKAKLCIHVAQNGVGWWQNVSTKSVSPC